MKRQVRKLGRRISAEKVVDPQLQHAPAGFLQNHHKTTAAARQPGGASGGTNPMLATPAPQRTKHVVRRKSDTAIREWDDLEAQRKALESLREIGPMSTGGSGTAGTRASSQSARDDGHGATPARKRAVRRSTVGNMDGPTAAYPTIAEAVPPGFASQTAPIAAAPGRRKPHMRRGSTEGALQLQLQRENRRGSLIFDLSDSGEPQLSSNLLPQEYDTLRSHDDVDADLDLARDTLPAGSFTGSREISELDLETASQMVGSKSVPTAGLVRQQETEMRSATEVQHAVSRARERMPSDEWSEEARRTTHEVLVTFDAIAKPNEGAGEGEDDSTSLTVWRSPDDEASGTSGANGGGAVGGPDGYNPQRLVLDTTRGDTTNGRQHSTSPSASPRRRGAGTPGGRARQKTMWSGSVNSSGDEDRQHDLSDTDSDHDGGDSSGGTGVHGHHRLRSGSGATDDGAHRIGGSDDGAQRIGGGVKSSDGATGSLIMRRLAPVDNLAVDGDRTYISSADPRSDSGDYSESSLSNNNSSASNTGRIMEQHSSSTTMQRPGTAITGIGEESDPARLPVGDSSTSAPLSEQAATLPVVDSEGGMRGGNIPPGGNDSSLEPMLKMMSERCTKVQQEKHQLEERVAELEREKKEWEMLKARLISTLVDEGEE